MPTMDFMVQPYWEPSRQGPVQFRASEVLRLWDNGDARRLLLQPSDDEHGQYRVAAVLPGQDLSPATYEALEDADILVVEVPEDLARSPADRIAAYLSAELNEGSKATSERMAALSAVAAEPVHDELQLSEEEEAELLDFVNDPANQLGGHF